MTGTEVNTPAWAERTLGVLLLPLAFVVMVGGGAGLVWLWRDYRAQLWIGAAVLVVAGALTHSGLGVANRQKRRMRWLSKRMGITPPAAARIDAAPAALPASPPASVPASVPVGPSTPINEPPEDLPTSRDGHMQDDDHARAVASAEPGDDMTTRELMLEVLARVSALQDNIDVLMGEVTTEAQRSRAGRHTGPVTVDIRDDDPFGELDDFEDDLEDDDDLSDLSDLADLEDVDEVDDLAEDPADGDEPSPEDDESTHHITDLTAPDDLTIVTTRDDLSIQTSDADEDDEPPGPDPDDTTTDSAQILHLKPPGAPTPSIESRLTPPAQRQPDPPAPIPPQPKAPQSSTHSLSQLPFQPHDPSPAQQPFHPPAQSATPLPPHPPVQSAPPLPRHPSALSADSVPFQPPAQAAPPFPPHLPAQPSAQLPFERPAQSAAPFHPQAQSPTHLPLQPPTQLPIQPPPHPQMPSQPEPPASRPQLPIQPPAQSPFEALVKPPPPAPFGSHSQPSALPPIQPTTRSPIEPPAQRSVQPFAQSPIEQASAHSAMPGAAEAPAAAETPERKLRRLVRDRNPFPRRDSIPAPREPVQVIELPRDQATPPPRPSPAPTASAARAAADEDDLSGLEAEDDADYFGEEYAEFGDYPSGNLPKADPGTFDESGRIGRLLGEDDDHRDPR